jgi:copper chaperone CopZ
MYKSKSLKVGYISLFAVILAFVFSFSVLQACTMIPGKSCCNEPCKDEACAYKEAKLIKVACGVCDADTADTEEVVLNVKGMTCGGCEGRVKGALIECAGVKDAHVNHKDGKAVVHVEKGKVNKEKLIEAVEKVGFSASEG